MATDWIENLRAAVWVALDANEALDTDNADGVMFKGTKVKFEAGRKVRLLIEPSACPILAMLPRGDIGQPQRPHGRGEETLRSCNLHFEMVGAGPGTSGASALYAEVVETLRTAAGACPPFGLADPIHSLVWNGAEFEEIPLDGKGDLSAANLMFRSAFDLTVAFRPGA